MDRIGIFIALSAGFLSFLSPCVLPLVPSYLTFVTGMSLEDLQEGVDRKTTLVHSLLFVVGFSLIFILLGASASFLGQFFKHYETLIARIGGVIIVLLGLHMAGVFRLLPLMREKRLHLHDKPAGYLGTLGVGMAFGAGWTPCIGPVLGAILTYGFSRETMWAGVGLLTVYSIGLAIPFLVAALALNWFLQAFKRFRRFMPAVEKVSGGLLVFLGLLLLTGSFTILSAWLARFTPGFISNHI
ncbi:MAG: cytochrome c biogenesis protein CcdA [Gemmatimonadetes bacterium]|nr:cytochrome c biogenesis protein CcdA [Gemmatimonadota bacterium]